MTPAEQIQAIETWFWFCLIMALVSLACAVACMAAAARIARAQQWIVERLRNLK